MVEFSNVLILYASYSWVLYLTFMIYICKLSFLENSNYSDSRGRFVHWIGPLEKSNYSYSSGVTTLLNKKRGLVWPRLLGQTSPPYTTMGKYYIIPSLLKWGNTLL